MAVALRAPLPGDAAAVAGLLGELGYPAAPENVAPRLANLARERGARIVVAVLDGRVVGMAVAYAFYSIHQDPLTAYLGALVVARTARRHGVGRVLVQDAEAWAQSLGAMRLSLVTGHQRDESHRFYESLGYARTGHRYSRLLE